MIPVAYAVGAGIVSLTGFSFGFGTARRMAARQASAEAEARRRARAAKKAAADALADMERRAEREAEQAAVARARALDAALIERALHESYADLARLQRQAKRTSTASRRFVRLQREIHAQRRFIAELERRQG